MDDTTPSFTAQGVMLTRAMALAAQITEANTIPILAYARLHAAPNPSGGGGVLTVTATDLDREIEITLPLAECSHLTTLCARPGILAHLAASRDVVTINHPAEDTITVRAQRQGNRAEVMATMIRLPSATDFPNSFQRREATTASIPEGILRQALEATRHFISAEETRYYLQGVFFTAIDGMLTCVATDGHRLARFNTGQPWKEADFILPEPTVRFLAGQLDPNSKRQIDLLIYANHSEKRPAPHISFHAQRFTLRTKTIDGAYPDHRRLCTMPEQITMAANFHRDQLRLFPAQRNDFFRSLTFDLDAGFIFQRDIGGDSEFATEFIGEFQGTGKFQIGQSQLEAMTRSARSITLSGDSPSNPFFATSADQRLLMIVMPMKNVTGKKANRG